jgi:hypothetical protein
MNPVARLYTRYAVALLGLTLLAGVHMRLAVVLPALRGALSGPNLVHAHSHAAFFGWAAMGVFALVTLRLRLNATQQLAHRVLAHATGIASAAAFVGFALRGYDAVTIALSAFHVALWVTFTTLVWRGLRELASPLRGFVRAGLLFLAGAGLATLAPLFMMIRGTTDPWLQQFGVKLFLTPFVTGFLLLVAMGVVYDVARDARRSRSALLLVALGTLPSTVLYVAGTPPLPGLLWFGRAGMALVGLGTLLFAGDVTASTLRRGAHARGLPPLAWLVAVAGAAKGGLELLAAAGVGASFMHNRAIIIAVLHLVLLGVVTPALTLGIRGLRGDGVRTLGYAVSLAVLTIAVGVTGWPWAARLLALRGVPFDVLFMIAALAGALAAAVLLLLVLPGEGYSSVRPAGSDMLARADRAGRTHEATPSPAGAPTRRTRAP